MPQCMCQAPTLRSLEPQPGCMRDLAELMPAMLVLTGMPDACR